ncbi:hypothetical protein OC844_006308 [Tilletia horrida]|nr:hypothetical protein OC844_006308 [Tilletia horrida]
MMMYDFYEGDDDDYESTPSDKEDSGSEGSDTPAGEFKGPLADLAELIAGAPLQSDVFSFGGAADFLPALPGLYIEGVGRVAVPVVDEDKAAKIMAACEQAPYGHGLKTVVDTAVRNSWQVDADKVRFENPAWDKGIEQAATLIASKFGIPSIPLSLHLYKFLLYKEGGHFAKHRDTEKEDRMFATMVIQLPSEHEGGQLMVYKSDDAEPVAHDFGQSDGTAPYKCHYAVHYADAEHAVTPITKGYRLALVYSICWPESSPIKAPSGSLDEVGKAGMALAFEKLAKDERHIHYFLEHAYTSKSIAELGHQALKGTDRSRFALLQHINASVAPDSQFVFFLGKAERHESYGGGGPSYTDVEWEEMDVPHESVTELISLDGASLGKVPSKFQTLEWDNVLNPDEKSELQLWHGHRTTTYEGYLGNEGPTKDTTYHKYVLLAIPRKVNLVEAVGETAAFHALVGKNPTPQQAESFFQTLIKLKQAKPARSEESDSAFNLLHGWAWARYGTDVLDGGNEEMRHRLCELVLSAPEFHYLASSYFTLYDRAPELVGNVSGWASHTSLNDLLAVMETEPIWSQAAIRAQVAAGFKGHERAILSVVTSRPAAELGQPRWAEFVHALVACQAQPFSALDLGDARLIKDLWLVAIGMPDGTLCERLVTRALAVDASKLDVFTKHLLTLERGFPHHYAPRRATIAPLAQKRIAWNAEQQAVLLAEEGTKGGDIAAAALGWRMPRALCPAQPALEPFLRGPDAEHTLRGSFASIVQARKAAEALNRPAAQVHASFRAAPGGKGREAYVHVVKTRDFVEGSRKERLGLVEEMAGLRRLVDGSQEKGSGSAPEPGSGSVSGSGSESAAAAGTEAQGQPPAKKRRAA